MGEEQGLSADSPALRLKRKAEWLRDQAYAIRAASDVWDFNEVQRLTSEADDIDALLNAARSEGLQPPVGDGDFSSLGASKAPSSASAGVAETPSGGWQDIASAPRDGTDFLALVPWQKKHHQMVGCFAPIGHFVSWPGRSRYEPTHWRPLPAPPTDCQTSGGEA